jgi:CBS domain-containing protein
VITFKPPERVLGITNSLDRIALWTIMPRDLVCVRPDLELAAVVGLITRHRLGCLPVVDGDRRPIGVITKLDICELVDAAARTAIGGELLAPTLTAQTAEDVMTSAPRVVDELATIDRAAAMMMSAATHHVLVVSSTGQLVGIVSARDIVAWIVKPDVLDAIRDGGGRPPIWHPFES